MTCVGGWLGVTGVVCASHALALVSLLVLALQLLPNARAEAQREVVQDGWAQAEAGMAADAPVQPPPRATRRLSRAERRAALTQELTQQAAEAHVVRPGDVRMQLRAPPHMSWVWVGREDMPDLGWRFRTAPTLCGQSCELSLPPGRVRLGLRTESGDVAMSRRFTVARPGLLRARYVSVRSRVARTFAIVLASDVLAIAAGSAVFFLADEPDGVRRAAFAFMAGFAVAIPGNLIGFIGLGSPRVSLDFTPGNAR